MPADHPERPARRSRLGLRGMLIVVAVVAVAFGLILPLFRHELGQFERYAWVKLNPGELLDRHGNVGAIQGLVKEFTNAIRSGHPEIAFEMTTAGYRRRNTLDAFRTLVEGFGMDRGPCTLVEATTSIPIGELRFVSKYELRCVPSGESPRVVELVVITESGQLRVNQLGPGSVTE
ncbi:hypothetical protein P12x_005450 [Tundrisphaera lichenicola]|uniref:hypothetical protein n=1 Tax=Tundrisphaera lichenicola TaxID=2029860 RepID=UPI003EBB1775